MNLKVMMTGPVGKALLLDESNPNKVHIMVATGTGIAPYRSFWRRMFCEDTPFKFTGLGWLFMGVSNSDAKLYDDELQEILKNYPDQFRVDYALSREQQNKDGGKMYIQDKVEEYGEEVFQLLQEGAIIYFCGLKGMMPGINDMLERVATSKGIEWDLPEGPQEERAVPRGGVLRRPPWREACDSRRARRHLS